MALPIAMTRYRRLILLALLLLTVLLTVELTGLREQFSLPALRALLEANLAVGLLLFVLAFVIGNLIQLPGWPFLAAAILALGTVVGGLVTYMAACVSCLVTFQVVKGLGGSALRDIDKPLAKKILSRLDRHPVRSVVLLRLLFQTMPALNYTLALSGVKRRDYLLGTLLGLPLPILVYCFFFDRIARVLQLV
ncbi:MULTISPECIES: VTT domain-containing protein [Alcanivorax]|uniref:VTT domain-containing protein n=1 Tax=Alcanivorax TaxID=59753 RepID=UPI0023578131|nr:VTT domain-containing protein [Alcanivorax jadensis]MDF1637316.1 VTT domain-containing protein [Alcanivorax jadensis]